MYFKDLLVLAPGKSISFLFCNIALEALSNSKVYINGTLRGNLSGVTSSFNTNGEISTLKVERKGQHICLKH